MITWKRDCRPQGASVVSGKQQWLPITSLYRVSAPVNRFNTPAVISRNHASSWRPALRGVSAISIHNSRSPKLLVRTAPAQVAEYGTYEDAAGPAFLDTLRMLEWQRLCEHLSKHASTSLGKRMCLKLDVPLDLATSQLLLQETNAMYVLENQYTSLLDYGGINTADAEGAIKRAAKGGMVSGKQLRGLVAMLQGAERLKRQIQLAARQNNASGKGSSIWPLLAAVAAVNAPKGLMRDITAAVNEDGEVADSAREQVRTTRGKVKAIAGRINNILKSYPGEASEKSGRLCVAVPAGTKITNGVMLGSSVGGGMLFIEPGQVVTLNNELAAARAEAMAAEESVLWELSGRVMGVQDDIEQAFNTVGWLDLSSAKVRFGLWLGAVLPKFTSWDEIFHQRSGSVINKIQQQQQQQQQQKAVNWDGSAAAGAAAGAAVHLRKFTHPLLLADYLEQQQQLERQQRLMSGSAVSSSSSSSDGGSSNRRISSRMLGTRKEVMQQKYGTIGSSSSSSEGDDKSTITDQIKDLKPPRAIDLVIQPETSVVVITGPNTGGKTATMKAFGLAVCMAKAGLLIPAQAPARIPCYSSVLADIGDEQSLTANLSTFSGHIRRISSIRAEADGRSLLLLDELGTGTDPTEGAALGQALLKQLIKGGLGNGALTIATTHHSIMTQLKFEDPRAENASVEFNEEALAPTYKLLWGVPGRSNALNIASKLGLDADIVAAARQRLTAGVAAANEAIQELEVAQEELRQADLAAYAVEADVKITKKRLEDVKNLVLTARQDLAFKRSAAIQEVAAAARQLLKALKLERKARLKGNSSSKVSRQLDKAMDDDLLGNATGGSGGGAAAKVRSLEEAIQSFNALSTSNSMYDTVWDVQHRQRQQQQWQQMRQEEEWVQTWNALLNRARRTLADGIGLPDAAAIGHSTDEEIETELELLYSKAAMREAQDNAQVAALQQMVDEVAARSQQQKTKAAIEAEVSDELFAAGVSLVEQALDSDEHMRRLQHNMQQQQAAAVAALQQQAEEEARKRAEEAALIAAFENELDTWHIEQIALDEQRQRQAAAAAAAAAEAQQQQEAADFDAIAAFEDMMLDFDFNGSSSSSRDNSRTNKQQGAPTLPQSQKPKSNSGSSRLSVGSQQQQQQQRKNSHTKQAQSSVRKASKQSKSQVADPAASSGVAGLDSSDLLRDFEDLVGALDFDDAAAASKADDRQRQQQWQQVMPQSMQTGKSAMKYKLK